MTRFLLQKFHTDQAGRGWLVFCIMYTDGIRHLFAERLDLLDRLVRDEIAHHLEWCEPIFDPVSLARDLPSYEHRAYVVLHRAEDAVMIRLHHPELEVVGE